MAKKTVKEKRKREPFWKKFGPDIRHVTDHIGHVLDNSRVSDFIDVFLYGGLAYLGTEVVHDWRGALIGPIGLKLAQSQNEISGLAGLGILATLGLASIPGGDYPTGGPVQEDGQNYLEITSGGETTKMPIHCEWVGGALGLRDQCRCWYPGLGWHYVDKKFCEIESEEEKARREQQEKELEWLRQWDFFYATGRGFCARNRETGQEICATTQEELLQIIGLPF